MQVVPKKQAATVLNTCCPWTAKEVSYYLGYSPRHVYQLARDGVLPGKKFGNRWYFDPMKIRAFAGIGV